MEEDPIGLCTQHLEEIGQLDAYVEAERARSHTPGLSLAVICDGTVVARGYGQANVELCVPATVDTVYELASVTKQFTAAAVMRLVEEDKLHLEDRISSYLPNAPTAWEPITVRHLLTNTSGVKDYFVHPALRPGDIFDWRKDVTLEEFVELVSPVPLEFPPGERYAYSNAGFNLLGIIIEKVTGQPYGQFLSERFFQPLGMSATRRNSRREIIPDRAAGYHWDNEALHNAEYTSISWAYAEGGIVSSVADLVKWDAALSTDTVLTAASREQMWTSARLNNGEETGYGFGWAVSRHHGHRLISHGGGKPGFSTFFARFVDARLTVIVLTNLPQANAGSIAMRIADMCLSEERPIEDEDPAETARLKEVLLDLTDGKADTTALTPEARSRLSPERLQQVSAFYRSLGLVQFLQFLEVRPSLRDWGIG